jgi:hypothetical protein
MYLTRFQKLCLGLSGATALVIGVSIALAPHAFFAGYGIALGQDPNLLSELRAPGAGLVALGAIMLAGILRAAMAPISIVTAFAVYLAFPVGRIVGIVMDGMPSAPVLSAMVFEIAIAIVLFVAFGRQRNAADTKLDLASQ